MSLEKEKYKKSKQEKFTRCSRLPAFRYKKNPKQTLTGHKCDSHDSSFIYTIQ